MFETPEHREYLVDLDDGVLRISFNRPEFGNAMLQGAAVELVRLFHEAQANEQVGCVLISGEGRNFSAGGDLLGFARSLEQDVPARQADFSRRLVNLRGLVEAVLAFDRPIVVSMRGAAAGAGLFYPLAADYVIGDPSAMFLFAHQNIGLCPDNGVSAMLPQIVGLRMARSLLLTAARVKAEEALGLGLVNRIVPPEDLEAEARAIALRLARGPRRAMVLAKQLVNQSARRPLSEQLDAEMNGIIACVGDSDFDEGVRAFLEKRKPNFHSAT